MDRRDRGSLSAVEIGMLAMVLLVLGLLVLIVIAAM